MTVVVGSTHHWMNDSPCSPVPATFRRGYYQADLAFCVLMTALAIGYSYLFRHFLRPYEFTWYVTGVMLAAGLGDGLTLWRPRPGLLVRTSLAFMIVLLEVALILLEHQLSMWLLPAGIVNFLLFWPGLFSLTKSQRVGPRR